MEGLNKRILCMLLLGILLISFTSALEFDNVKSYDPITREVTVTNAFGLGNEIGKARLNTALNVKVPVGYQKVAEFDLWAYEDYNNALKQFNFLDMKNNKVKINRDYDLKYLSYESIEVDDYKKECEEVLNQTNNSISYICEEVLIGSHFEEIKVWNKITPADMKKNDFLTIGVFIEVQVGDYIDWIPSIYGVEIEEWATWTADLNIGLNTYYKLDEVSGIVIDSIGNNNATNNGSTTNVAGKINTAYSFDGIDNFINVSDLGIALGSTTAGSWSIWIKPIDATPTAHEEFIMFGNSGQNDQLRVGLEPDGKVRIDAQRGSPNNAMWRLITDNAVASDGTWMHVVLVQNGTDPVLYINGTAVAQTFAISTDKTWWFNDATHDTGSIGRFHSGVATQGYFNGIIDEVGFWNRSLNQTEVTKLYNNGTGLTFEQDIDNNFPTIILNSPLSDANYTTPQNITFNFTAYDDISLSDVKLYVNSILNQTNASGINDTVYLFTLTLEDGDYTFYGKATDNASQETNTASIRIVINTTPFIEFLTPPTLINYANVSQSYVPMKVNVSTSVFENITYSLRNVNGTNYTQFYTTQTYDINFTSVPDGHYHYDVTICTTTNKCNTTETRHINHDVTAPTINLTSPSGIFDFLIEGYSLDLNWSVSDEAENLDSCWYTYPSSFNVNFNETNIIIGSGAIASESIFDSWLYDNEYFIKTIGSQDSRYEAESFFSIENVLGDSGIPIYLNVGNWQDATASANDPSWIEEFNLYFYNYDTSSYDTIENNIQSTNPGIGWTYVDINYTDSSIDTKYISGNLLKVKIYIKRHDNNPSAYSASSKFELNYSNVNQINQINQIFLNCSLNTTQFNYSINKNNIVFYANDTFGNIGNETTSWSYLILQINQTYDSQVTEGTPNTITTFLNVVGDTISSAILSYNGTNYTTSLDYDSGNYTMASTVVAPLVSVDTNITFQLFMVISGVEYSIPVTTQLIQAINFSTCTTGDKLLNIFLFDEEHKTELSGDIEINAGLISKISGEAIESVLTEESSASNVSICLDPISSVDNFYLDADIVYSSSDYAKEFYFMRNADLSVIPINLSLFDLNLSSSTEFLVRYQGQNLIKVEGAIVQLQRYYISEGLYETVEAPLTSISGTAIVHIDLNTNKYKAIVVKDGVVLDIFDDVVFDCENELSGQCTQNLYADVSPYNIIDGATLEDFSYGISDTGSKLVTTFSIPSGSTSSVNIVMIQRDQFGDTTSCNRTVTTSSGSLECDYNQTIGDSYLFLEINKDGESQAQKEYFVPEANAINWGGLNWLFLFGLLISLSLMAISSPEWIVGNAVITFIIGGALWLAEGLNIVAGLGLVLWLLVSAILLILEMAKQEDR